MPTYDAIILGLGAMGSAALRTVASRHKRVLGIDAFGLAHDRGSSHGQTRIIRRSYFEHPDYVPLLHRCFDAWKQIQRDTNTQLYHRTGLLLIGHSSGEVLTGVRQSADQHQLSLEDLSVRQVEQRFRGFAVPGDMEALFEPDGGFLLAEDGVRALIELAANSGAETLYNDPVTGWHANGSHVEVRTATQRFETSNLVICAGPWSSTLLQSLNVPFTVRRKSVFWFDAASDLYGLQNGFPPFCVDSPEGFFYGFPIIDGNGLKVAEHSGGQEVDDPTAIDREVCDPDLKRVQSFLQQYLPSATTTLTNHSVCMYTVTPDDNFVIDRHPNHENVVFAAGFSGHGFKFAPVVGEMLADLVETRNAHQPLQFLSLGRLLRD